MKNMWASRLRCWRRTWRMMSASSWEECTRQKVCSSHTYKLKMITQGQGSTTRQKQTTLMSNSANHEPVIRWPVCTQIYLVILHLNKNSSLHSSLSESDIPDESLQRLSGVITGSPVSCALWSGKGEVAWLTQRASWEGALWLSLNWSCLSDQFCSVQQHSLWFRDTAYFCLLNPGIIHGERHLDFISCSLNPGSQALGICWLTFQVVARGIIPQQCM